MLCACGDKEVGIGLQQILEKPGVGVGCKKKKKKRQLEKRKTRWDTVAESSRWRRKHGFLYHFGDFVCCFFFVLLKRYILINSKKRNFL